MKNMINHDKKETHILSNDLWKIEIEVDEKKTYYRLAKSGSNDWTSLEKASMQALIELLQEASKV